MNGQKEFENLALEVGSTFLAVNIVASKARQFARSVDNKILDSKAITWALTGIKPESSTATKKYKSSMYDILAEVSDSRIKKSVIQSVRSSNTELQFVYDESLTHDERARVRILTRIILDK